MSSYIATERLLQGGDSVLAAVSGGTDSIVMLHLLVSAGIRTEVAHMNFQLRGDESARDESFVRTLAQQYGLPFHTMRADAAAYAAEHRVSVQVAARELRYAWLETLRQEQGLTAIATAHQLQDNAETLWMNIAKGTGIAGMHGILPKQGRIIRPLLFATRGEITAYAAEHGLQHVEDSSNTTDKYTRNFFRHRILPQLEEAYPEAVRNAGATIARMREAEMLYQQALEAHRKKLLTQRGNQFMMPVLLLQQAMPLGTILYELLKPFGFSPSQSPQIQRLLDSDTGRWVASDTHRIVRDRKWLIIAPLEAAAATYFVIEEGQDRLALPEGEMLFKRLASDGSISDEGPLVAHVDAGQLEYPLLLRRWKQGDYFYPLGLRKKKKLSRFFIDQKLSLPDKEKVWVLESGKRIVWVAGLRIDDRFRITPATRQVLRLQLKPGIQ
ncbi:tRNA lysidine(34) synthetase TilS [Chitinophaga lutea]